MMVDDELAKTQDLELHQAQDGVWSAVGLHIVSIGRQFRAITAFVNAAG